MSQFLIIFGTASKSLQPRFLEIFNIMLLPNGQKVTGDLNDDAT